VIKLFPGEVINLPVSKKENISFEMMVNEMNNYDEKRVLYNMFKNLCENGLTTREAEVAMGLSRRSYYRYKKIYG
jgi:hypothetical protein